PDPTSSLGTTLDAARRRADGEVILKWDDDDLYSSDHVADLVRARHYSQASVVGKACEFVYFGGRNVTIRRQQADREAWSPTLSGNTLMIDRDALDAVGGWANRSLGEDADLIVRIRRAGGRTYRTVGFGMIVVRHADVSLHTWSLDANASIEASVESWPGLANDEAMVDAPVEVIDAIRRSAGGAR
ncbi:MAG: glycosyltransferase, partial [Ilumatobacteraceae bacterium]